MYDYYYDWFDTWDLFDNYIDILDIEEKWRIYPFNSKYYVSTCGRIVGPGRRGIPIELKTWKNQYGHHYVSLYYNGKQIKEIVHRMAAETFIPNPRKLPVVRHLDDNPDNNYVENLAWGTQYDNVHDCIESGHAYFLSDEDREIAMQKRRTPIRAIRLSDGKEENYISQQEAERKMGIDQASINAVLRNKNRSAGGYYFMYADDERDFDYTSHKYSRYRAPIEVVDTRNGDLFIFKGQTEAANKLGLSIASVSMCLSKKMSSAKGYKFRYLEDDEYE